MGYDKKKCKHIFVQLWKMLFDRNDGILSLNPSISLYLK